MPRVVGVYLQGSRDNLMQMFASRLPRQVTSGVKCPPRVCKAGGGPWESIEFAAEMSTYVPT